MFLSTDNEFEIVAEAQNGHEAIAAARALSPDVILMDLFMPQLDGILATQVIRSQQPETAIIALSNTTDDSVIYAAIEAGIDTFMYKGNQSDQLIPTIKDVLSGKVILPFRIRERILLMMKPSHLTADGFSLEELRIIRLLFAQKSDDQIAQLIGKPPTEVRDVVSQLQKRANVSTRLLLILHALQAKLI